MMTQPQKAPKISSLEQIRPHFTAELQAVSAVILAKTESQSPLIPKLAAHVIASGGKRLRPVLTILSAKLCGYDGGTRHINLAAAVEFIHTATLLHDDVVDESKLRRGVETANNIWGNQASVLVGDFLLSRAFQLMVADGSLDSLRILSDASAIISEGEVLQLTAARNLATTEAEYLTIITAKTAALFSAACEVGAVVADAPKAYQQALQAYGNELGIAFQIADDVLDYSASQEALGKELGDDFREGKITLPVIYAYEKASAEDKAFWKRTLEEEAIQSGDLARAMRMLEHSGALAQAGLSAKRHSEAAKLALAPFPDSAIKDALLTLADFATERLF